jgi:hypothetical protein
MKCRPTNKHGNPSRPNTAGAVRGASQPPRTRPAGNGAAPIADPHARMPGWHVPQRRPGVDHARLSLASAEFSNARTCR